MNTIRNNNKCFPNTNDVWTALNLLSTDVCFCNHFEIKQNEPRDRVDSPPGNKYLCHFLVCRIQTTRRKAKTPLHNFNPYFHNTIDYTTPEIQLFLIQTFIQHTFLIFTHIWHIWFPPFTHFSFEQHAAKYIESTQIGWAHFLLLFGQLKCMAIQDQWEILQKSDEQAVSIASRSNLCLNLLLFRFDRLNQQMQNKMAR